MVSIDDLADADDLTTATLRKVEVLKIDEKVIIIIDDRFIFIAEPY